MAFKQFTLFIALAASTVMHPIAAADDMDAFFEMTPEELANISVSIATGTAKPVYQSAAVTSVITAQQIKSMGATDLSQVLETVPGLHVRIQGVNNDPVYSMRGMGNNLNNQVLVLLNGTRYSTAYKGSSVQGMEVPLAAIKQIEVIRGPGSALYGADAFAGVINIITKKAKEIEGTEIGVRAGSWDTQSVWGLNSSHWLGWDIATSIQFVHNNNDDDRIIKVDAQSALDAVFATNASLAPGEMQTALSRWDAHLNLQRQYWEVDFWAFQSSGGMRAGTVGALDKEGRLVNENYLTAVHFSSDDSLNDWVFSADMSYLHTNVDANIHLFPDGAVLPINAKGHFSISKPVGLTRFTDGMIIQAGIKNQVAALGVGAIFKGFKHHLLKATAEFRYEHANRVQRLNYGEGVLDGTQLVADGTLVQISAPKIVSFPDSSRSIWSVALQDEWQLAADWQLTAGVRFDQYSDFGSTINPRIALLWEIDPRLSAKFLYGHAFRAPSFIEQGQKSSIFFNGNRNIKPETVETIEIAFDYRPNQYLRLASNFYYYDINDMISPVSLGSSTKGIKNTVGQESYGTEFEWDWQFHPQWNLKGNYAWQYSPNKATKKRAANVPEHQVYSAIIWEFLPQWKIQTQINWIGHRLNGASKNKPLKEYETVDITLSSQRFFGYIDFSASAHNVFGSGGREPAVEAYPDNLPIASRSFYLQTTVHF